MEGAQKPGLESRDQQVHPLDASTHDNFYQVPACCQCSSRELHFGGFLPVPRDEANLPYWVPRSLRPQRLVRRTAQSSFQGNFRSCTCFCHSFGGQLPVPRELATFPYWVPRSVRFLGKANNSSSDLIWTEGSLSSGLCYFHNQWRVCCDEEQLQRWQMIQAQLQMTAPRNWEGQQKKQGKGWSLLSPGLFLASFYGLVMILVSVIRFFFRR